MSKKGFKGIKGSTEGPKTIVKGGGGAFGGTITAASDTNGDYKSELTYGPLTLEDSQKADGNDSQSLYYKLVPTGARL